MGGSSQRGDKASRQRHQLLRADFDQCPTPGFGRSRAKSPDFGSHAGLGGLQLGAGAAALVVLAMASGEYSTVGTETAAGFSVLRDHDIDPELWSDELWDWSMNCSAAVVLLSSEALTSDWCRREHAMLSARTDLSGADLRGSHLREAQLHEATYSVGTIWPPSVDPVARGAVEVSK